MPERRILSAFRFFDLEDENIANFEENFGLDESYPSEARVQDQQNIARLDKIIKSATRRKTARLKRRKNQE